MDGERGWIESKRGKEQQEKWNGNTNNSQKADNQQVRKVIRKRTKECKGRMWKTRNEGRVTEEGKKAEKVGS